MPRPVHSSAIRALKRVLMSMGQGGRPCEEVGGCTSLNWWNPERGQPAGWITRTHRQCRSRRRFAFDRHVVGEADHLGAREAGTTPARVAWDIPDGGIALSRRQVHRGDGDAHVTRPRDLQARDSEAGVR